MFKEMSVIPVNKVTQKNNQKKMEGRGGEEAQGVADPQKSPNKTLHPSMQD
jgi:hypothetical protein